MIVGSKISNLPFDQKIDLKFLWFGWQYNKGVDKIYKTTDIDKWETTQRLINNSEQHWEPTSLDKFVSDINRKTIKFNSKYLCPETESTNAFSFIWSKEAISLCHQHIWYEELSNIF